jgi:hypothetical protein
VLFCSCLSFIANMCACKHLMTFLLCSNVSAAEIPVDFQKNLSNKEEEIVEEEEENLEKGNDNNNNNNNNNSQVLETFFNATTDPKGINFPKTRKYTTNTIQQNKSFKKLKIQGRKKLGEKKKKEKEENNEKKEKQIGY